ncbi:MAG TPA: YdeI/OmpD-associated family protein [Acidimicrobiales bacterium]
MAPDSVTEVQQTELVVVDVDEWRAWLADHCATSSGVWLVLAKKGTTAPTSLSYDQALDEALCQGWIDGQLKSRDDATFRRRFTPRKPKSIWSERNTTHIERLRSEGRMQAGGEAEVAKAQADGRWDAAYAGQAAMAVPNDLVAALAAQPEAATMFETLTSANRYAVLFRIANAKKAETRANQISRLVDMLARGETLHPQAKETQVPAKRRSSITGL